LEIYGLVRSELLRKTGLHGTYHGTDKRILAELSLMGPIVQLDEVMLFYRQHPVQAKRYHASAAWREAYAAGESTRQLAKIPRIRNMIGYSAAVKNADLSMGQRLKCYVAVGRWFLQPNKWAPLLVEAAQNTSAAVKAQRLQKVASGTGQ
jgi:hypothetical protein